MRYGRVLLVLLACLSSLSLAGCFGGGGGPSDSTKTFNLTGKVTSVGTGHPVTAHPISGARVEVGQSGTFTDAQGLYQLAGLTTRENQVTVTVSKENYATTTAVVAVWNNATIMKDFYLTSSPTSSGIVRIEGYVGFASHEWYGRSTSRSSFNAWVSLARAKEPDSIIVKLKGELSASSIASLARDTSTKRYEIRHIINRVIMQVPEAESLDGFITRVMKHPLVAGVEVNGILAAAKVPNDPFSVAGYAQQWYWYAGMNLPGAWEVTTGSRNVTIAVVDTGIRYDHPDIGNLVQGWDFVDSDADPFDPGMPNTAFASHGTHVAGTIGALTNNGVGVAGINWSISIMPVRVLGTYGYGTVADVASGIRWAADRGANVINLSLGIRDSYDVLQEAVRYAANRGVILVAASGNEGASSLSYPAAYPEVIAVGAAATTDSIPWFSNTGIGLDLIAPGFRVYSTNYNSLTGQLDYAYANGTSMASPHVAGLAALMLANGIPSGQVREIFRETAIREDDSSGWDPEYGYGFVNAYAAVTNTRLTNANLVVTNDQFDAVSQVSYPSINRAFSIGNMPQADKLYVFGWIDINNSRTLDPGDYTGYVEMSTLGKTSVRVDLKLNIHCSWSAAVQKTIRDGLRAMGVDG